MAEIVPENPANPDVKVSPMLQSELNSLVTVFSVRQGSLRWHAYPNACNRRAWNEIPIESKDSILADARAQSGKPWPLLSAKLLGEYKREGTRLLADAVSRERIDRLFSAALAWAITGGEEWGDEVMDGLLLLVEQTSWCLPAHENLPSNRTLPSPGEPFLDLSAGYTAALIAYCDQILGPWIDQRDARFRDRLTEEVRRRVLRPFMEQDWWWMGANGHPPNNWNPWIVSNVLASAQSFANDGGDDAGHPSELDLIIERSLGLLDVYLSACPDDGSCEEGTAYWWWAGGAVFDALRILEGSTGVDFDANSYPAVRNMPRFVRLMAISDRWNFNFGDATPQSSPDARWHHLYQFSCYVNDYQTASFAKEMRKTEAIYGPDRAKTSGRVLAELFDQGFCAAKGCSELEAYVWLPDGQLFAARELAGCTSGFYVGAKGGSNGVSHNHNDVGSFTVAFDGNPVVIDIGAEKYNASTFSKERYEIWTNRSAWHNVPEIMGTNRWPGQFPAPLAPSAPAGRTRMSPWTWPPPTRKIQV